MIFTKSSGYKSILRERVAESLRHTPEFMDFMEERLAVVGTHGFRSTGFEAVGSAFLGISKSDSYGSNPDPDVALKIQSILDKDPFLRFDRFRFQQFERPVRAAIGKAVTSSNWWDSNAKEVRRVVRAMKEIEEIQET